MELTYENILTLAPDPGTAQRAKGVAFAQRWLSLEGNGRAVWGTLGNPADPYRTAVDLQGPAFRCSCPVRRQPCKHGIGLLLLFSKNNDAFSVAGTTPEWVDTWLEGRDKKIAKQTGEAAASPTPEDPALAEKRKQHWEKRKLAMTAGLAELENWIADLLRQGLATLEGRAADYLRELAARMVDAKLGSLARRIRQLHDGMGQAGWHEKLLAEIGDMYLLVKAFQRMEQLPGPLQEDLLAQAGVNLKKEDLITLPGLLDTWLVAGQTETAEDNNLLARRTWLLGEKSGQTALLLDFSWGGQPYDIQWKPGSVLSGEAVFYPSAYPQRALMKNVGPANGTFQATCSFPSLTDFATRYADALAANPWLSLFPAFLDNVVPVFHQKKFVLVDTQHRQLPLTTDEDANWELVAVSGGRPLTIFGTWDGEAFMPLSTVINGMFKLLHLPERRPKTGIF